MARKRKMLPKDFEQLIGSGDLDALKRVYDECELTAYDLPSSKHTALHFRDCPDELARWLVGQGLDVDTPDAQGETPLCQRVIWGAGVSTLLELGANPNAQNRHGCAPLHHAITRNPEAVRLLVEHHADMTIYYASDVSSFCDVPPPLQYALQRCSGGGIPAVAESARIMLDAGCPIPENAAEQITRIGKAVEFAREGRVAPNARTQETDRAMAALYEMFGVTPVAPRRIHDGSSPITVVATEWRAQFHELWEYLVPASGAAATKQGEVIRAAGRISRELLDNGGINWSRDYRSLRDDLIKDLASGTPVTTADELTELARGIMRDDFDDYAIHRITELAVAWVLANPIPLRYDQTPVPATAPQSLDPATTTTTLPTAPVMPPSATDRLGWLDRVKARLRHRRSAL